MNIEIRNPTKPINAKPMAATLAVVLYSLESGFLRICQTLLHCIANDFILNIKLIEDEGF